MRSTPHRCAGHADRVAADAGHIDICFNLIGHGDVHGTPLIHMDVEDFVRPIDSIVRSTFLTSQATARHMVGQGAGVILIFGGEGDPMRDYSLGGTLVAFHAQETMRRQLACELGPLGVRVITIITGGIPETIGDEADADIVRGIEYRRHHDRQGGHLRGRGPRGRVRRIRPGPHDDGCDPEHHRRVRHRLTSRVRDHAALTFPR